MSFQFPDDLPETYTKRDYRTGRIQQFEYAESTKKVYKSRLNWLAKQGYDTPEKLMAKASEVANLLNTPDRSTKALHFRRNVISAIMWVVPEQFSLSRNPYYDLFQQSFHEMASDFVGEKQYN